MTEIIFQEESYQSIPFTSQKKFPFFYRHKKLQQEYIADFVCYAKIMIECKAVDELHEKHESQVLNY